MPKRALCMPKRALCMPKRALYMPKNALCTLTRAPLLRIQYIQRSLIYPQKGPVYFQKNRSVKTERAPCSNEMTTTSARCVTVCCSVVQCVAVCSSMLPCVTVCCSVLQRVAACCSVLQCVAVCCMNTWGPTQRSVSHLVRCIVWCFKSSC